MKKLIIKILLFVFLLYIPLYFLQNIVDKGLRKYQEEEYSVWNDIFEGNINAELIIIGASRSFVNISPLLLDSTLHQKAYNLGIDGGDFNLAYTRLKVYLRKNKKPKTIIYSISTPDLQRSSEFYNMEQFIPYLNDTILRNGIEGYENSFKKFDYIIPAMKYRSYPKYYSIGVKLYYGASVNIEDGHKRINGYQARPRIWDSSFHTFKSSGKKFNIKPEFIFIKQFYELIDLCKKQNIKLYFVFSPEYKNVQPMFVNRDSIFAIYSTAARLNNIPFFNYSNDSISYNTKYFYNSEHLNQFGSEIFTRKLAMDIKNSSLISIH